MLLCGGQAAVEGVVARVIGGVGILVLGIAPLQARLSSATMRARMHTPRNAIIARSTAQAHRQTHASTKHNFFACNGQCGAGRGNEH
eukprot:6971850-Alexandrium_andersonii.AAC.1